MRTSRFASLTGIILIALLLTTLLIGKNQALANPLANLKITDIEPAVGQCMPGNNTLVLKGTELIATGIHVLVQLPDSTTAISVTVLGTGGSFNNLSIQIPQSHWLTGTYTIMASNSQGQKTSFDFVVERPKSPYACSTTDNQGLNTLEPTEPVEEYSRGDGR